MNERLVKHLAAQYDRNSECPGHCPDENAWALLADGLISPSERDELLDHARSCSACRRRMSTIVEEWDDEIQIADGAPYTPEETSTSATSPIRLRPARYALAACLVAAIAAGLYFGLRPGRPAGEFGVDISCLVLADASLVDIGVDLRHRALRAEVEPAITEAEYRRAIEKLRIPLEQAPPPADALAIATRAGLSARFFEDAVGYAEKWRGAAPEKPHAYNACGLALYNLNEFVEALAAFEQAIELAPDWAPYRLNAALAADEADLFEQAHSHLLEFKRLAPDDPNMGEIDRWLRRLEE